MRRYLLVGRTGVGKSSFINATFGTTMAKTSAYEACTKLPEYFSYNTPFGNICLIDTPGLAEGDSFIDKYYLSLIKEYVKSNEIDTVLYVSRFDETRFRPDEKRTLRLLTDELGPSFWQRAWLILTFAANVLPEHIDLMFNNRTKQIQSLICDVMGGYGFGFSGFGRVILVDNFKEDWARDVLPISSFLAAGD